VACDGSEGVGGRAGSSHSGRIVYGAQQDEIVVHDRYAVLSVARLDELELGSRSVYEQHVDVTPASQLQRFAASDGHRSHARLRVVRPERDHQRVQQSRVMCRCGSGKHDRRGLRGARGTEQRDPGDESGESGG
jgi:hypothetical protein